MTAADLIERIEADGLTLRLAVGDEIKASGEKQRIARWLPELKERKAEIVETLKTGQTFTDWRIHFDQSEKWVVFPDGATRAEVEALYPEAAKVEPIERPPPRPATPEEEKELRALITALLSDTPEEIEETVQVALGDVEAALVCGVLFQKYCQGFFLLR